MAKNHQATREELMASLGMSTLTGLQMQTIQQTVEALDENE